MRYKLQSEEALNIVTKHIGVSNTPISYFSGKYMGPLIEIQECIRHCCIHGRTTEPCYLWQNRSEGMIKILNDEAKRRIIWRRVPNCIWDFVLFWEAKNYSRTYRKDGSTPMEMLRGNTIEISEWMEFEFYNSCWYWKGQTDKTEVKIGRFIGVSHRVGSDLCYWVLT